MRFSAKQIIVSSTFASALFTLPAISEASELKLGMNSPEVKELQDLLKAKGFFTYRTSTGYFGPITEKAVREFQAAARLTPTGIVDKTTYNKLKGIQPSKNEVNQTLKIGTKGDSVKVLQQQLKSLGYFSYPEITGYYGTVTAEAVKKFQRANGLTVNGIADSKTIAKLEAAVKEKKGTSKQQSKSAALKPGSKGNEVRQLQSNLKLLGFFTHHTITDYYGTITSDAVRKFQQQNGLAATGIADSTTLQKIRQAVEQRQKQTASQPTKKIYLTIGSTGEHVKQVQMKLKQLGYFTYPTITEYYGSVTAEAVKQFQKSQKLNATGNVDQKTYDLLIGKGPAGAFDVMHLIADAAELLGTPYIWGGSKPEVGFDCSGFLVYVFNQQGVSLPRTVAMIWNVGTAVDKPSIGDIVFFETYQPGASHAGIYIGNNQFIHSGSSTGVAISSLDSPYWSARYLGAKRYY